MSRQAQKCIALLAIVFVVLLMPWRVAWADSDRSIDSPFTVNNKSPFVAVYGLPAAESADISREGQLNTAFLFNVANNFNVNQSGDEAIIIDGETLHSTVQFRYGFSDRLEVGLDISYVSHDGGSLDSFIDDWHEVWGFPDGGRPALEKDQLNFSYQRQGNTVFSFDRAEQGVGDAKLSLAYQLSKSSERLWALRSTLKLPTANADALLGSESTDVSVSVNLSDKSYVDSYGLTLHASAGLLWMDEGEVLNEFREDWVAFGSATLSWQMISAVSLKLQLDTHSAFYDSSLTELGSDALQLTLGGTIKINKKWSVDLAIIEDIIVDTSPDVVFHFAINSRY